MARRRLKFWQSGGQRRGIANTTNRSSIVPHLPLVRALGPDTEWHAYLDGVYGKEWRRVRPRFDLNRLSWFYWGSPLDRAVTPLCVSFRRRLSPDQAWIAPLENAAQRDKYTFRHPPEGRYQAHGFFVARSPPSCASMRKATRLEVLRTQYPPEKKDSWFYHLEGTGIFAPTGSHNWTCRHLVPIRPREVQIKTRSRLCLPGMTRLAAQPCPCRDGLSFLNCGAPTVRPQRYEHCSVDQIARVSRETVR